MEKNIEVSLLLDFYGELLKPASRQVIDLYYNDDLSLSEIALELGITRQGVRDKIKRCEAQLFELEEKLGLMGRFHRLEQGLDGIAEKANRISLYTDNQDIKRLAGEIIADAGELRE